MIRSGTHHGIAGDGCAVDWIDTAALVASTAGVNERWGLVVSVRDLNTQGGVRCALRLDDAVILARKYVEQCHFIS